MLTRPYEDIKKAYKKKVHEIHIFHRGMPEDERREELECKSCYRL
jgi:hypothetical protein